ncbi:MAG: hypothetical protein ACLQIB_52880 [Isosphaeraceae bacterium]
MSEIPVIPELLLAQARAGDTAALGQLFELYRNHLVCVLRRLAKSEISCTKSFDRWHGILVRISHRGGCSMKNAED